MECDEAKGLFATAPSGLDEAKRASLKEHLEACRRCRFALRREKLARAYCNALGIDIGLKKPVSIRAVLKVALPALAVAALVAVGIIYWATRPPEPRVSVPHALQIALEDCSTVEGVCDWAMLPELDARMLVAGFLSNSYDYYGVAAREMASNLAGRLASARASGDGTPADAEAVRRFVLRALSRSVPKSKAKPEELGKLDKWTVSAVSAPPEDEAWKLGDALDLERCSLYGAAAKAFAELAGGASDATVRRRAGLHALGCRLSAGDFEGLEKDVSGFAAANAGNDQGRLAARLVPLLAEAAKARSDSAGKKKAEARIPDRELSYAAFVGFEWARALEALQGEDVYGMATFSRAYALRRLGRIHESSKGFADCRYKSRDSNMAALSSFEAARQELLLGDYDMAFSWMDYARERQKNLPLGDAMELLRGVANLRDYDAPTAASAVFAQMTGENRETPIGRFVEESILPALEADPRVKTGERDVVVDKRIFTEDFEDAAIEPGLSVIGPGAAMMRSPQSAAPGGGSSGASVSGSGGAVGVQVACEFDCVETVVSAWIRIERPAEKVMVTARAADGSLYRGCIYGLPQKEWRAIVYPLSATGRRKGAEKISGKKIEAVAVAVFPADGGEAGFSIDSVIIHNGSGFAPQRPGEE